MTAISYQTTRQSVWKTILLVVLAFWLSSVLMLDGFVMPSMYASGMMTEPSFASAGYGLFWMFNRVELLCAALVLTGALVLHYARDRWNRPGYLTLLLASLLLMIVLIDTYALTPHMSALGLHLNLFAPSEIAASSQMNQLHLSYWLLDGMKLSASGILLWLYNRALTPVGKAE